MAEISGFGQALDDGMAAAGGPDELPEDKQEQDAVSALWKEYETARKFDAEARAQYAIDRRYAAGTADMAWAVKTNLIGSYIDILTSFLYAKNPDVSVKKAAQVNPSGSKNLEEFAKTSELIISRLWKQARLKEQAKKQVRSALSVGTGWLKVIMVCDGPNVPQMLTQLNDIRDNVARLNAAATDLAADKAPPLPEEEKNAKLAEYAEIETSLVNRIEVVLRKGLAIDFVSSENMQVSLDVACLEDHIEAGWNANAIYKPISKLKELFPRLTDKDIESAKQYHQRRVKDMTAVSDRVNLGGTVDMKFAEDAEQYVPAGGKMGSGDGSDGIPFGKIIELWHKDTGHVKTMVEGVKKWAKEPYEPDYPTTRFYPYFYLSFFEVDGSRHPQSLSWRLSALQDEYCRSRSNFRVTRERSIPGTLFNATDLEPEDVRKIEKSVHQEFVGIKPTSTDKRMEDMFAAKPVAQVDMRLYDNTPILADMEKIAGVQEALQSSVSTPKTATEAGIQQSGFESRTNADRDALEQMLSHLAQYTEELALGALTTKDAQKICGAGAFWPHGMALDDLLTMVEVEIQAGSTGKPRLQGDQQAWGAILPQLKEAIAEIQEALLAGNLPLAKAVSELVRETMRRFGDDVDVDRFIPQLPEIPAADPAAAALPGLPAPAAPVPGEVPPEVAPEVPAPAPGLGEEIAAVAAPAEVTV